MTSTPNDNFLLYENYTLSTCSLPKKYFAYPSEISFICLPLPTSFKNRNKFVFLLLFYVSRLKIFKKKTKN